MIHEGNLEITKENQNDFKELREVTGSVYVYGEAKFPNLETVGGFVYVYGEAKLPKLETVGGYVAVSGEAKLPKLETVGGYVAVSGEAKLPKLETVGGYVDVYGEAKLDAPKLETVGGSVYVYGEAKLDAPNLETVGGFVYVLGEAKLPKLETVGGDVSVSGEAKFPNLETVGGFVYVYGEAKLPKLETVGGYVAVSGEAKLPKNLIKENKGAKIICELNLNLALWLKGMAIIDGILTWVMSEKKSKDTTVFKVRIVGKLKTSFVVQRGETFAHGETIKKAIEDLRYKVSDRDKSEFEKWRSNLDMQVSLDDAIAAYRVITGACSSGVKGFVEQVKVPEKLTPNVIIELTKGSYGSNEFERFLKE